MADQWKSVAYPKPPEDAEYAEYLHKIGSKDSLNNRKRIREELEDELKKRVTSEIAVQLDQAFHLLRILRTRRPEPPPQGDAVDKILADFIDDLGIPDVFPDEPLEEFNFPEVRGTVN